jgi:hypothetical protein
VPCPCLAGLRRGAGGLLCRPRPMSTHDERALNAVARHEAGGTAVAFLLTLMRDFKWPIGARRNATPRVWIIPFSEDCVRSVCQSLP